MAETGRPDVRHRHAGEERRLGERAVAVVPEQEVRNGVVGDEHVEAPVVIVVGKRDAHALADVRQQARPRRHVLERAVAAIAIEAVRQPLEEPRMAVDPDARAPDRRSSDSSPAATGRSSRRRDRAGRRCRSRTSRRPPPTRRWRCRPASSRPRTGRRRDCAAAGSCRTPATKRSTWPSLS